MFRSFSKFMTGLAMAVAGCDGTPESAEAPKAAARQPAATAPVPKTTDWTPDASLLGQLAAETEVLGNPDCTIRPPTGYQSQPVVAPAAAAASGSSWIGPTRPDGTAHALLVIIVKQQPGQVVTDLGEFAAGFLSSRSKEETPLQMEPAQNGKINGLSFARVQWSAQNKQTSQRAHGIVYVASPGQVHVIIDSQDVEPYHKVTLKLAEAAARTFKLRTPGR